jgi:hypothetical protein
MQGICALVPNRSLTKMVMNVAGTEAGFDAGAADFGAAVGVDGFSDSFFLLLDEGAGRRSSSYRRDLRESVSSFRFSVFSFHLNPEALGFLGGDRRRSRVRSAARS